MTILSWKPAYPARLAALVGCLLAQAMTAGATVQAPGPSAALFGSPYYSCVRNFYIATTGSDSNNGSIGSPWATLQHANDAGRTPGDCVNVEPGTYNGVSINSGGNTATSTGYVTYRCTTMDACTINGTAGPNGNEGFVFNTQVMPRANYVIVDGFTISGSNTTYGIGFGQYWPANPLGVSLNHHIWLLNSIVYNNGQGGIGMAAGEFFYIIHNTSYNNANVTCNAQGSGIGFNSLVATPGYTPTSDDQTNPNPLIGSFVTGASFFRNAVEWNIVYNNALTSCGSAGNPYDTDGNNIIMDSFGTINGAPVDYTNQTLIAFNVTYNAGGGGVHIFASEYVTAANNTCYNNYLDPYNQGATRACIDTNNSYANTIINNIAVGIPAAPSGACTFGVVPYAQFSSAMLGGGVSGKPADTFSHNITQLQGGNNSCWGSFGQNPPTGENPMFSSDTYSCASNKCATNPMWVNVGNTSVGTETTQPVGANFALQAGSPAIGYGLTETYLSSQSVDVGACSSALLICPNFASLGLTVAILSPANGATVGGTISIQGTASDSVTISSVAVSVDGGAFNPAVGTNSWSFSLNTLPLINGAHRIQAQAWDLSANTSTSTIVNVTVSNLPPTINSSLNISAVVNVPFSYQITATQSPTSYNATGLPPGLSINTSSGIISGIPTSTGTFSVALSATNSLGTGNATLTLTIGTYQPLTAPGLNAALVYPNPVIPPYNPVIRICPGIVDSVDVTIFDISGHVVNSSSQFNGPSVPSTGAGSGQYCYEYTWSGHVPSGVYFAVVHAHGSGTTVKARLKFAVVR